MSSKTVSSNFQAVTISDMPVKCHVVGLLGITLEMHANNVEMFLLKSWMKRSNPLIFNNFQLPNLGLGIKKQFTTGLKLSLK
jgi:hypothetical protein